MARIPEIHCTLVITNVAQRIIQVADFCTAHLQSVRLKDNLENDIQV